MTDNRLRAVRLFHDGEKINEIELAAPVPGTVKLVELDPYHELVDIDLIPNPEGVMNLHQVSVLDQLVWDTSHRTVMINSAQSVIVLDDGPWSDQEVQIMGKMWQMIEYLPPEQRARMLDWLRSRSASTTDSGE